MSKRASYVSSSTYILISFRRPVDGLAMLSYWKKTPCPRRAGQGGEAAERYGGGDNGERPARWIAVLQPQEPAAIPATRSGRELCRGSCRVLRHVFFHPGRASQICPIHIWPQIFAAHDSVCFAIYGDGQLFSTIFPVDDVAKMTERRFAAHCQCLSLLA